MIALLTSLAIASILAGGSGAALLLTRGTRPLQVGEFFAASWLLGAGAVSVLLALGGCLCSGPLLFALVLAGLVALAAAGWVSSRGRPRCALELGQAPRWERWASLLVLAPVAYVAAAAFRDALAWDGILNWEAKARMAYLAGGRLPLAAFTDASRSWTHPAYPLGLPFTELWVYLWVGDCHQGAAKAVLPFFHMAATALLWSTALRLGVRPWAAAAASLLVLGVPVFNGFDWGLLHGYADLPLAALYLGGVAGLLAWRRTGDQCAWRLGAAMAALLPWFKQEGVVLWACLAVQAALLCGRARWRQAAAFALPGCLVWLAWRSAMGIVGTPEEAVFYPLTWANLMAGSQRTATILAFMRYELGLVDHWSLLWFLTPAALACLALQRRREAGWLAFSIGGPLAFDFIPYLLTRLEPFQMHVATSFKRLALHVALVALLAIALALEPSRGRGSDR